MFLQRQIAATTVEGEKTYLADGTKVPYKLTDVLPKYALKLGEGKYASSYIGLDDGDSYVAQLPEGYASTEMLSCIIRSQSIVKVVIVSPDHGTSTFLLKGTNGTTNGDHPGLLMWQGTVTSITISSPTGAGAALVDYFFFEIPDLTSADSWRLGNRALGVISE